MTSSILQTATRFLMPLLLLFAVFLLLRGHNEPGGGFVGGLVVASAFVLYSIAYGVSASRRALLVDPATLLGVGLLITEGVGIDHPAALGDAGLGESNLPHLYGDEALAGWKRVVAGVHRAGGKIIPQLWHQGVMRDPGTGPHPQAPSLRPSGLWGPVGRAGSLDPDYVLRMQAPTQPMSESDIQDVIDAYARSARHARCNQPPGSSRRARGAGHHHGRERGPAGRNGGVSRITRRRPRDASPGEAGQCLAEGRPLRPAAGRR